ncbi:3-galactosyltransferase 20) [Durusdinium trenchii]|uniref:3-galactosyltransferase 20 n=1 Tax=Durusdinium trenchii TaxID=1381693 RepID=A0ABP0M2F8_9DINO
MLKLLLLVLTVPVHPSQLYDGTNFSKALGAPRGTCRALYWPTLGSVQPLPHAALDAFDVIITDDVQKVPWLAAQGKFYFLENRDFALGDLSRELAQLKEVLLPASANTPWLRQAEEDVKVLMPASYFMDDGTFITRNRAFANFTFSALLLLDQDPGIPPQSLIDCIAHGTVPIIVGKHHKLDYTRYFSFALAKFRDFSVEQAISFMLTAPADALYVYANSVKIVQEFFYMRYKHPFQQRLRRHADMACHALRSPQPPLAFVSIYSAKRNFGRRLALRDTWLPLLKTHGIPYRFFLAGTAVDDTELDSLLRRERDYFDDMVFLVGTTDEYPIGKKGLAALLWVAHHSDAQFWLKFDDDLYVRPQLVLSRLAGIQRAELYWGAFDYSGMVIRDASDPHYTPPEIWPEPVFPPYARGAALAMSMDLVRLIAHQEEHRPLKKIKVEDVSYGFYLWQLIFDREVTSLTLYDRDEVHFAMDAKCCTEETHPNNCWLPLTAETWIVHHVSPNIIRCMFAKDIASGFYLPAELETRQLQGLLLEMAEYDHTVESAAGSVQGGQVGSGHPADLCGCVVTPPPHPGKPLQRGRLTELSTGPRLHS